MMQVNCKYGEMLFELATALEGQSGTRAETPEFPCSSIGSKLAVLRQSLALLVAQ